MEDLVKLEKDESGKIILPEKIPSDQKILLNLMDGASEYARIGQGVTSGTFDHGMMIFNQLNAHFQTSVAREIAKAHAGLSSATTALKVATWWLAGITVLLGVVELLKLFFH
jgi:hypothetical protein